LIESDEIRNIVVVYMRAYKLKFRLYLWNEKVPQISKFFGLGPSPIIPEPTRVKFDKFWHSESMPNFIRISQSSRPWEAKPRKPQAG